MSGDSLSTVRLFDEAVLVTVLLYLHLAVLLLSVYKCTSSVLSINVTL